MKTIFAALTLALALSITATTPANADEAPKETAEQKKARLATPDSQAGAKRAAGAQDADAEAQRKAGARGMIRALTTSSTP